jgi:hypothetical protein
MPDLGQPDEPYFDCIQSTVHGSGTSSWEKEEWDSQSGVPSLHFLSVARFASLLLLSVVVVALIGVLVLAVCFLRIAELLNRLKEA